MSQSREHPFFVNIFLNNYTKGAFTTFAGMFLFLT